MTSNTQALPGDHDRAFPLPELAAIGDAICHTLQLGNEEELLGEAILTKVQALIARNQVTSADVVRLALVCDALSVAEEAAFLDGSVSEVEVGYTSALAREAAARLSAFREYYAHHADLSASGVRGFLSDHRADKQMFGGACADTRWLGLSIVRRLAQVTRARDVFDKYTELMLRLSAEIVALGDGRVPSEQLAAQLEQRLGLHELLVQAETEAPAQLEDPRIRVFCSPDAPDVFHAVEHANQISVRDPFDVESVQSAPRAEFSRLLQRAARQRDTGTGRVLLILGDSGSGKTHLMRVFRNQVHGDRQGYVGYLQVAGTPGDYNKYVLGSLIDSLEKPYDAPEVSESALMCLSDTLLLTPASITPELRFTLQEAELSDGDVCDLVYRLADDVVNEPRFAAIDLDLIRALLFLQRREPRYYGRVIKFLRGQPLSRHDNALLGDLAPRTDNPFALLEAIGRLIACVDGGALVLLLDQLEDIYNQQTAKEQFVQLMDVVCRISNSVPNALVVVSCLRDLYPELRKHLTRSVLDRIEHDPEPQRLLESRSLAEIETLVERRLRFLYESQGVRHRPEEPHFPIPRALLESQAELRLRDVLKHLQGFQQSCIAAGKLVEAPSSAAVVPAVVPQNQDLGRAWTLFAEAAEEVPSDDEAFCELLAWSLQEITEELPDGVAMLLSRQGETLLVTAPNRGEGNARLFVRLLNQASNVLAKRLELLCKEAQQLGRVPVAVRCSEFGGKPGSATHKQLGILGKAGGRRVVFEQATWKQLLAFRKFRNQHANAPGFREWCKNERPLLKLSDVRSVLGFPTLGMDTRDVFVPERAQASQPKVPPPPPSHVLAPAKAEPAAKAGNDNAAARPSVPIDPQSLRLGSVISVKQDPALIKLEQLKRHCAFLGATGSGKTTLALNVIEQAAQRGVGTLLLDRKGDLAAFADPRCWERPEPDPKRAQLKHKLRDKLHVRVFTPGNALGSPLGIRPVPAGLGELPQQERAHLARFAAQGLGSMMGYKSTQADQALVAVLAKAIEVIAQLGRPNVGLRELIDLLADEDPSLIAELGHLDLKHCKKAVSHLEVLRLNHGALLESQDPPLDAQMLLGRDGAIPAGKVPLTIISTKFLGGSQRVDFWVSQLLVELTRWCSKHPSEKLQSLLFLDEADIYLPASSKPATKDPLQDLLKRARSAGVGVMLATQNPGDLDYKGRDSIGTWWVGRIASSTAIDKMKPLLSECRTDVSSALPTAGVGEFFQISEGHTLRMRADRSLMDTVQLSEERILELAGVQPAGSRVAAAR